MEEQDNLNIKSQVRKDLTDLPTTIMIKGKEIYDARHSLEEKKLAIKTKEAAAYNIVEAEGTFSNVAKREAERDRRLLEDVGHQAVKTEMDNLKIAIDNMALNLEYINNRFSAAKALSRILGD